MLNFKQLQEKNIDIEEATQEFALFFNGTIIEMEEMF
jgi:hypothetical protein